GRREPRAAGDAPARARARGARRGPHRRHAETSPPAHRGPHSTRLPALAGALLHRRRRPSSPARCRIVRCPALAPRAAHARPGLAPLRGSGVPRDFGDWRVRARERLSEGVPPDLAGWSDATPPSPFDSEAARGERSDVVATATVPKDFLRLL